MIFTEANVAKILAGTKTQTRRQFHSFGTERAQDGRILIVRAQFRNKWEIGHTYAVQPGRGRAAVARIRIESIRYCERGAYVNDEDARAEGFATPQDFYLAYLKINGPKATARPAWALTFTLVRDAGASGAGG